MTTRSKNLKAPHGKRILKTHKRNKVKKLKQETNKHKKKSKRKNKIQGTKVDDQAYNEFILPESTYSMPT